MVKTDVSLLGAWRDYCSLTYPALDCWRVVALVGDDMGSSSESSM